MKHLIITFIFLILLSLAGCERAQPNPKPVDLYGEPEIINDKCGFMLMDLDGFEEDKSESMIAWGILTLRKPDVRITFGFVKGARMMSNVPGMPAPGDKKMLYEWSMGMLQAPKFYPATTKAILSSEYIKIDNRNTLVNDILLEFNQEKYDSLPENVLKTNAEEIEFLKKHKRGILRTYHIYRGRDMFHIEFFTDPLTYHAELKGFLDSIILGLRFKHQGE
ncbi:hypothetical protein KKB99_08080 [bacterium]|nr:hypothetical protein [bacterium]MBU1025949.1 hypothetical protein [bacterium]